MKLQKNTLNTKIDFQHLLLTLLNPLKPFYSEKKAGLFIGNTSSGYEDITIPMEAFARPLWGLVPFWKGGGQDQEFESIYLKGLRHGTAPDDVEYWQGFRDFDQRFVEMAALSVGLLMTPEKLWEPLSSSEKQNVIHWLSGINNHECPDGNWHFFAVLVNIALKKVGASYSQERLDYCLAKFEDFYLGDGWYMDGPSGRVDYYTSFAIHYYGLLYSIFMEQEDPKRCRLYKERSTLFAYEFIYWFSEEGSSIPFGRSQTYRFAQMSFFSACLLAGIEPYPIEIMKGILVRHLEYWLNEPIFDNAGILTIGYCYPNLLMAENYNAPGSPYWSMKAFLFLALPDTHPFWKASIAPLPKLDSLKTLKQAQMVISRKKGDVTAYVSGLQLESIPMYDDKYAKFAYSTLFGFSVARSNKSLLEAAPDSMLVFEINGYYYIRRTSITTSIKNNIVTSLWSPYPDIHVETQIIPTKNGHKRKHTITSQIACAVYDCGFSVAIEKDFDCMEMMGNSNAKLANSFCSCEVQSVTGHGTGLIFAATPNTNLLYSKTKIPAVAYVISEGIQKIETHIITDYTPSPYSLF